jgi:prepilin-type processing-associated H-X9-DG protein
MSIRKLLRGFTLIELLTIVSVIGILAGILLPAILRSREAARQTQCADNIKQLTQASQKYYEIKKEFPYYTGIHRKLESHGYNTSNIGYSVQAAVLPYMGQTALFETFSDAFYKPNTKLWMWLGFIENSSRKAAQTDLAVFRCPADSAAVKSSSELTTKNCGSGMTSPVVSGNYMACNGSGTGYNYDHTVLNDGLVGKKIARTLEMVTAGAGNTIFFSEAIIGDASRYNNTPAETDKPWIRTATVQSKNVIYRGASTWLTDADVPGIEGLEANEDFDLPTFITVNTDNWFGVRGFSWIIGDSYSTGFTTFSLPNPNYPDWCDEMGIGFFAARSFHPNGVNASRADGSVTFIPNTIDRKVWQQLGSIK